MSTHRASAPNAACFVAAMMLALTHVSRLAADERPALPIKQTRGTFETIQTKQGIEVRENGKPVLFYQMAPKQLEGETPYRRSHYVHPVYDLAGDTVITEDFPDDHKHHRGIFWAWHQVLVGDQKAGDAWVCTDFEWKSRHAECKFTTEEGAQKATQTGVKIVATTVWQSKHVQDEQGELLPIANDEVSIHVHPRTEDYRAIDFTIRLQALQPNVRIGGSNDAKGYGGFSPRIRMPEDLTFIGKDGPIEPTLLAIESGRWMKFESNDFSYAILNHIKNPGNPTRWILRQKRSMQNPVYPGQVPVELSMNQPTTLRYRVLILKGRQTKYQLPTMLKTYDAIPIQ